ncbi:MAG TPA: histidinol-phosphate transaminase [Clostridia bacterium]|nr:histidinol-phosphate transaminase [Clostridia bacterium]
MSQFFCNKYSKIAPYVAGEQPKDKSYVKLNTNESPYPPSKMVADVVTKEKLSSLNLYPDPCSDNLRKAIAKFYNIDCNEVLATNGSDEALTLAFMAYCIDEGIVATDISYGFYPVLCSLLGAPHEIIPLKQDFTMDIDAFCKVDKHIVIANPNAPTGIALKRIEMEKIISANPNRIVIVDEAYVDFGAESCIPLIKKYSNLLVIQTLSKSRGLAGARIGFVAGKKELIEDLEKIRNSFNPYNVNSLSQLIGIAAIGDKDYFDECVAKTVDVRYYTAQKLEKLGFEILPSCANFVFAKHKLLGGKELYQALKKQGVLVRHFDKDRIRDFVRISIGSKDEMDIFIEKTEKILKGDII